MLNLSLSLRRQEYQTAGATRLCHANASQACSLALFAFEPFSFSQNGHSQESVVLQAGEGRLGASVRVEWICTPRGWNYVFIFGCVLAGVTVCGACVYHVIKRRRANAFREHSRLLAGPSARVWLCAHAYDVCQCVHLRGIESKCKIKI